MKETDGMKSAEIMPNNLIWSMQPEIANGAGKPVGTTKEYICMMEISKVVSSNIPSKLQRWITRTDIERETLTSQVVTGVALID